MAEAALSPLSRLYKVTPVLLVAGLTLIWASRPTIPVVVRGMGVMAPPDARRGIYARGPGEVQQLKVRVGDQVRPGQLLLTLSQVGQSAPGGGAGPATSPQLRQARLAALDQQVLVLQAQTRSLEAQRRALAQRRQQIITTNQPVGQQLKALDQLRRDDVVARYSPLWVGAQDLWLRNRADLSALDARQAELVAQRAAVEGQRAELRAQRAALASETVAQEVFSPVAGRVQDLAVLPGQPVLPGQKLGSIGLPGRHGDRLAIVLFTAADATRLQVGDDVRLNPQLLSRDSFGSAEQRYGLVPGRLISLSSDSVEVADVATEVGSQEEAANLMASARQRSFGDGGDLTSQLPGRTGAPLVLAVVQLEAAPTPSGLAWTLGRGPGRPLPQRTPAEVEAEVETRAPLSYLLPFWRWMSGSRS
ncbi:MAG: biotin/lipoyl-binding protein [Synechococcaceae cyanobacterium ELA739]